MGAVEAVTFANETFYADNGSSIYSSTNGEDWTVVNSTQGVRLLGAYGQRLIGASGSEVYRSEDGGFSWQSVKPADGGPGVNQAAFGEW